MLYTFTLFQALWECILEARIKLQKLLSLANQVPQPADYDEFLNQVSDACDPGDWRRPDGRASE